LVYILTGVVFSKALHWLTCVRCVLSDFEVCWNMSVVFFAKRIRDYISYGLWHWEEGEW
jgi:hypothetical protein